MQLIDIFKEKFGTLEKEQMRVEIEITEDTDD